MEKKASKVTTYRKTEEDNIELDKRENAVIDYILKIKKDLE